MTKLILDNIVQQKLGELNIKYKSEYWDEMEEKLNSSPTSLSPNLGASSSISSTYLIAIATIGIAALSVVTFILLNNENSKSPTTDVIEDKVLIENTETITDTKQDSDTKTFKEFDNSTANNKTVSSSKINSVKLSSKKSVNKTTESSLIKTKINISESKVVSNNTEVKTTPVIINNEKSTVEENSVNSINNPKNNKIVNPNIESNQNYKGEAIIVKSDSNDSSSYIKKASYHKGSKENNGKEDIKKNNNLKNVTPITKPVKRVFKKRKGGLWGLISRK